MTESKWMLHAKKADFNAIGAAFHISPVTARIIRNRDVVGEEAIRRYLNGTVDQMYDPRLLPDMDLAAQILEEKIRDGKRIRIVGDYDLSLIHISTRRPSRPSGCCGRGMQAGSSPVEICPW